MPIASARASSSSAAASTWTVPSLTTALHCTFIAREANSSAPMVSSVESAAGLTQTRSAVRQLPPTEPSSTRVSLESR